MSNKRTKLLRRYLNTLSHGTQHGLREGIKQTLPDETSVGYKVLIRRMKKSWNKGIDIRTIMA